MRADGTETWGETFDWLCSRPEKLLDKIVSSTVWDINLLFSILMQVALATFIGTCLHFAFKLSWFWASYTWGGTAVALLLGWTKWIQVWFAQLRFNFAAAYENALYKREEATTVGQLTTVLPSTTTRIVIGSAIVGTNPFQRLVRDKAVNLTRALEIKPKNIELLTKDGAKLLADIEAFFTALRSSEGIRCLIQHREVYIVEYLTAYAVTWLKQRAKEMTLNEIFSGLLIENGRIRHAPNANPNTALTTTTGTLEKGFSEFLGGKDVIHPIEAELGGFTGNPLVSIRLDPALAEALQSTMIVEIAFASITKLAGIGGMKASVAANVEAGIRKAPLPAIVYDVPPGTHIVAGLDQRRN